MPQTKASKKIFKKWCNLNCFFPHIGETGQSNSRPIKRHWKNTGEQEELMRNKVIYLHWERCLQVLTVCNSFSSSKFLFSLLKDFFVFKKNHVFFGFLKSFWFTKLLFYFKRHISVNVKQCSNLLQRAVFSSLRTRALHKSMKSRHPEKCTRRDHEEKRFSSSAKQYYSTFMPKQIYFVFLE